MINRQIFWSDKFCFPTAPRLQTDTAWCCIETVATMTQW